MNEEPNQKNWYKRTFVRVLLLLLLPLIVGGLYIISTRIILQIPTAASIDAETQ
jgi:hypothetical protein